MCPLQNPAVAGVTAELPVAADPTCPLVSVVTPVLNGASTIQHCIDSVRLQDYPAIEHIVIDGGSTDGTVEILRRNGMNFVSEPDCGIYDAMSKGVSRATGEFIHICNADDRYASNRVVSTLVSRMRGQQLDLCHARVRVVRGNGQLVRVLGRDVDFPRLLRRMTVAHPTVMVHRSVYQRFGAFSVGFRVAGDYEFLLRVWRKVRVGFLDEELMEMETGGASFRNPARSLREAMAAALIHGAPPARAALRFHFELLKYKLFFERRFSAR